MKRVIAIMGKAGSGKDTIAQKIVSSNPDLFNSIVSCTSRPMREGEQDGVSYYFITRDEFMEKIKHFDMLEAVEFNSWYYGAAVSSLSDEKINVGVFNPAGVRSLMVNKQIDLEVYYLQASDKTRLLRQLQREQDPDVKEIVRRFGADEKDFADVSDIDYIELKNDHHHIVNDVASLIVKHSKFI